MTVNLTHVTKLGNKITREVSFDKLPDAVKRLYNRRLEAIAVDQDGRVVGRAWRGWHKWNWCSLPEQEKEARDE